MGSSRRTRQPRDPGVPALGRRRGSVYRRVALISSLAVLSASLVMTLGAPLTAATGIADGDLIGPPLGVMPPTLGNAVQTAPGRLAPLVPCPQPAPNPACNMTYHGGPLVLTNTTRIVYWEPAGSVVSANYHSLIQRFLTDVAADSGRVTNAYATDTQYNDSTNTFIQYNSTFGGAFTDATAFPATVGGCPLTDGTNTVANCLTQTQQSTELDTFIQTNGLPRGINNLYFLVMPQGVETCFNNLTSCGSQLTGDAYCAYHSWFNIASHGLTIWANEPYIRQGIGCDSGVRPNGDDADMAINPLSHEHNEIITDPNLGVDSSGNLVNGGWYDVNGTGENGDKCNFSFGPTIASTATGAYDQLINHNPYEIQQEWSNAITGCAANFGALDPTAAFTFTPPSPAPAESVNFDGTTSHSNNAGGYIVTYDWDFGDLSTGSGPTPSHAYAVTGTYTVSLTVTDDAGLTDTTSQAISVDYRLTSLSPVHAWIGLKNSDDQGTQFDVRAELLKNGTTVVATGLARCITGVTRNPLLAKDAVVTWDAFAPVLLASGDVLSIRLSTRVGTTSPLDAKCSGPGGSHNSAVGLRVYYDASTRASGFDATITPNASIDQYLHSNGSLCGTTQSSGVTTPTVDAVAPGGVSPRCLDSPIVKFTGGNPYQVIATWDMAALP